ncbi:MAG: MerR family transcriptional regulator [Actinobacteria bacterium]|nr:MerR family transcriptional regulator [Actinomycetota bacterium]
MRSQTRGLDSIAIVPPYERRGILPPPPRQPSGYRTYTDGAVERIRLAKSLQALGFTLDEINGALHSFESGNVDCESEMWRMESVLDRIDAKLKELRRTRREIVSVLKDCRSGRCRFAAGRGSIG